jgi:hypothetical protein
MSTVTGLKPNPNYLKSAIGKIYGDEDDFIVLGLTGRTGSGCSTAAQILRSSQEDMRHSLFTGENPDTNEQRKERIILRHFKATWSPFLLIQVRAVITTFLLDTDIKKSIEFFNALLPDAEQQKKFSKLLKDLRKPYVEIKKNSDNVDATEYFTSTLPATCDKLRSILGESSFVQLYQIIGKNIRLSGDPYNSTLIEGQFFTLADRVNWVIKKIREARTKVNQPTYIVIDAIRNPLEALFFQDRYASFFLVAVSSPESDRKARLRQLKYS